MDPIYSKRVIMLRDDFWFELFIKRRRDARRVWGDTKLVEPHSFSKGDRD